MQRVNVCEGDKAGENHTEVAVSDGVLSVCPASSPSFKHRTVLGRAGAAQSQHLSVSLVVRIFYCQSGCCTEWRGLGQGSPACALGILREIPR